MKAKNNGREKIKGLILLGKWLSNKPEFPDVRGCESKLYKEKIYVMSRVPMRIVSFGYQVCCLIYETGNAAKNSKIRIESKLFLIYFQEKEN